MISKEDAIAFWNIAFCNTRHELSSIGAAEKAVNKKSYTACIVVELTTTILADDLEEATKKAEACDWEECSDISPDFKSLKWIEEDE